MLSPKVLENPTFRDDELLWSLRDGKIVSEVVPNPTFGPGELSSLFK